MVTFAGLNSRPFCSANFCSFDSKPAETMLAVDVLTLASELWFGRETIKSAETPRIERSDLEIAFITGLVLCSALFLSLVSLIL